MLASGIGLIAAVGLPGTIELAGMANLALAASVGWLNRGVTADTKMPTAVSAAATPRPSIGRLLLLVALATGLSSFIYEMCWIRRLSRVLGAATHSFELMLSAFILGLALGGWWIRLRIDRINDHLRWLGTIQIAMGVCALISLAT